MRRFTVALAAMLVLATGCSSGENDDPGDTAASTTGASSPTPAPTSPAAAIECQGLGQLPVGPAGEVTWIEAGRLWAAGSDGSKRCLLADVSDGAGVSWGGGADRVLVGNKVVLADGRIEEPFPTGGQSVLSRPTGKSVLDVRNGKLTKRELGKSPIEITFLEGHEQSVYHPAGRHIVSVGKNGTEATLHIATNMGQSPSNLVKNETAQRIYDPTFTASGALLFFADHGTYTELHRLEIDQGNLTTVAKEAGPASMDHLVTSPFEGGGVAWEQGACDRDAGGRRLQAQRGGEYLKTEGTVVERGQPVGWTPDAALLVMTPDSCPAGEREPTSPRALYRFMDGVATEVARGVQAAGIRALLPPPPEPPKLIPQQAPA